MQIIECNTFSQLGWEWLLLDCSRIAKEIAMVRGFFSKEGGRRYFIIASDKNEKEQKNLRSNLNRSIIARNRTITKQRTLKHETNKTDRNPPIPNHKPWPFELV